jgi:hypothetical protein
MLDLGGCQWLTCEALSNAPATRLQHLVLSRCARFCWNNSAVPRHLSQSIVYLDVSGCRQINGRCVQQIASVCPSLVHLNLSSCSVTIDDASIIAVAVGCPLIEELLIAGLKKLTDLSLYSLRVLQRLRLLSISGLEKATLAFLSNVFTWSDPSSWTTRTNRFRDSNGRSWHEVDFLSRVHVLSQSGVMLEQNDLRQQFDTLFSMLPTDHDWLPALHSFHMEMASRGAYFNRDHQYISYQCMHLIGAFSNTSLEMSANGVFESFRGRNRFSSSQLDCTKGRNLCDLNISYIRTLTDDALSTLVQQANQDGNLRSLQIRCTQAGSKTLESIGKHCLRLATLDASSCLNVCDDALSIVTRDEFLVSFKKLQSLSLANCPITHSSMHLIMTCFPSILHLNVKGCPIGEFDTRSNA